MLRGVCLFGAVLFGLAGPAAAQSDFDATGQFTLSFKFGKPGQEEEKPRLGFRFGASNVPQVRIEEHDPTRRDLNLTFDRRDHTMKSFAGVEVQFGEADKETIHLLDDPFSPAALGLDIGEPEVEVEQQPIAGYLKGSGSSDPSSTWSLGAKDQATFGWSSTPLID